MSNSNLTSQRRIHKKFQTMIPVMPVIYRVLNDGVESYHCDNATFEQVKQAMFNNEPVVLVMADDTQAGQIHYTVDTNAYFVYGSASDEGEDHIRDNNGLFWFADRIEFRVK